MRITQQMLHQNSLRNINQNLSRFENVNNQISTGKKINKPSDNPTAVSKAMKLKSELAATEQYEQNTTEANLWLDEADQTIKHISDALQRARELVVEGNNGTMNESDRVLIANEVEAISEQIRQFANSKVNGHYLFNGQKMDQPPYPEANSYLTDTYDTGSVTFTIGNGVTVKGNVTVEDLFGSSGDGENLFKTLDTIVSSLKAGDEVPLDQLDKGMDRVLSTWSEVGARKNRVEAMENRLQDSNIELQTMLSKVEDINYAETLIKLKSEEAIYQASLSATSRIIQPTLMDFLR